MDCLVKTVTSALITPSTREQMLETFRLSRLRVGRNGLSMRFLRSQLRFMTGNALTAISTAQQPLQLMHGWSGSVIEYINFIDLLTDLVAQG